MIPLITAFASFALNYYFLVGELSSALCFLVLEEEQFLLEEIHSLVAEPEKKEQAEVFFCLNQQNS